MNGLVLRRQDKQATDDHNQQKNLTSSTFPLQKFHQIKNSVRI